MIQFNRNVMSNLQSVRFAITFSVVITLCIWGTNARSQTPGTTDATYTVGTGTDGGVFDIKLQSDGKLLVVGGFTTFYGGSPGRIGRLNTNGTVDGTFSTSIGANFSIISLDIQSDGKVIVGGQFTAIGGVSRGKIARLGTNGAVDATFNPAGADGDIYKVVVLPDDKILIGGDFTTYNGTSRNRIAKLNANGTLDATFNPGTGVNGRVRWITPLSSGKVIICGEFTSYNGAAVQYIARLNADGSLDNTFAIGTGPDTTVQSAHIQADGRILIAGVFNQVNGTPRAKVARLNANGSIDPTFAPVSGVVGSTEGVYRAMPISDGKILIIGWFTFYDGVSRTKVARLNMDGTLDLAFNPGTGATGGVGGVMLSQLLFRMTER
jgi:uncharacterized delta-60 repeat protein